jgi:hypothetical protein
MLSDDTLFSAPTSSASLSPVLSNPGIPAAMKNGQNDDTVSFRAEVHAKRKSLGDNTANILVNR